LQPAGAGAGLSGGAALVWGAALWPAGDGAAGRQRLLFYPRAGNSPLWADSAAGHSVDVDVPALADEADRARRLLVCAHAGGHAVRSLLPVRADAGAGPVFSAAAASAPATGAGAACGGDGRADLAALA